VEGTLNYMAGSVDETIAISGSMVAADDPSGGQRLVGNVEITLHHHATGQVPGMGKGEIFWDGSDPSGTIQIAMPASTGTPPSLFPFSAYSGGTGSISGTCKGDGYTVPAGDPSYMFKELPVAIGISMTVTSNAAFITVLSPGYSGTLTATIGG
jgi:hypothetical protein